MASKIEKIIVPADCPEVEDFLPNVRDGPLGIGLERHRCRFRLLNLSGQTLQRLTIHLSSRRERKGIQKDPCGGNHVPRQAFSQKTPQLLRGPGGITPRNDTAHQSWLTKSRTCRLPQAVEKEPPLGLGQLIDSLQTLSHVISPPSQGPSNPPTSSGSLLADAAIAQH